MQRQSKGETSLVTCHREYGQAEYRVKVILQWTVDDEEGQGANIMDE
jgi:hypothetical protein